MKKLLLLSSLLLLALTSFAQKVPRFTKYDIANTGCKVYMPAAPEFSPSAADDSSEVYMAEVPFETYKYGVILVKLHNAIPDNQSAKEQMLISMVDKLKQFAEVTGAAGYGKGHTLDSHPAATGIIDFWHLKDNTYTSLAGWMDSKYCAILYISSDKDDINSNFFELFRKGFRFPE